jgi:hypothetical protein
MTYLLKYVTTVIKLNLEKRTINKTRKYKQTLKDKPQNKKLQIRF